MYKIASFLFFLLLFLGGCGHGSSTATSLETNESVESNVSRIKEKIFGEVQPPAECTLLAKKKFVYDVMHDSYLWADETKEVDYTDDERYPDEETLLNDLRNPKDRFSFIMSQKAYDDFFEAGKNVGFGIFFRPEAHESNTTLGYTVDALVLLLVYPESPADKAGLKRSDRIVGIDDYTINQVFADEELFKHYLEADEPITVTFHLERNDGTNDTVTVTKAEYNVKTVIKKSILERNGRKIGYLLFQSFVGTSESELTAAFSYFKESGIDDLVLDLRYNGGGYVYIARQLASLIGGWYSSGKVFNQTLFNQKYSRYNYSTYFYYYLFHQLSLPRLYVITTSMTCSASELVINSLRASAIGVEVIGIGEHTCGKPYAMIGGRYCDKYILPVQMKNANADGEGDYVDGLPPVCRSRDNDLYDFADPHEDSFAEALYYIEHESCKPETLSSRAYVKKTISIPAVSRSFRGQYGIY